MRNRSGFTLIEILVSIVIISVLAIGVARFSSTFSIALRNSSVRVTAAGVANDQLQLIRADSRYAALVTNFNAGTGSDTTGFSGFPNMHRVTRLVRDQAGTRDRTTVTVRVTDPSMPDTVSVTSVIASP